nr:ATP synthase F1 subunit epsilon [Candidatus Saccharibacteria bacterium]
TPDGLIGIFAGHMPLVSIAVPGIVTIRREKRDQDDKLEYYATDGGVIEIMDNVVRILADEALAAEEVQEETVKKALADAKQAYDDAKDTVSLSHAQAMIDRQSIRLDLTKYKRHSRR